MNGFESTSTATLLAIKDNLRRGLDVVAQRITDGTFHTVGPKGAAPPAQAGHLTLALLDAVTAELARRAHLRPPTGRTEPGMTDQTDAEAAPSEAWKTPRHQVEAGVKLADAPLIRAGGKTYRPYSITFDHRRTGNGPWRAALIAIYATKQHPGGGEALVGSCLHPSQLDEMPAWLADIIARATPAED